MLLWMSWETYTWDLQVLISSECFALRKSAMSWAPLDSLWEGNQPGNTAVCFREEIRLLNSSRNDSYLSRAKIYLQTGMGNPALLSQSTLCPLPFPLEGSKWVSLLCTGSTRATTDSSSNQAHVHSAALTTINYNYLQLPQLPVLSATQIHLYHKSH